MKSITLKCGASFIVDDEDFVRVSAHKWCLSGNKHVMRYTKGKNPLGVYIHHFIVGQPLKPMEVDHINRNPLDNRKSNLRFVSKRENSLNRGVNIANTSGVKGVYKKRNKWRAACFEDSKYINLGHFKTKEEAIAKRRDYENKFIKTTAA